MPADFPSLRATLRARGARTAWLVGGAKAIAGALAAGVLDRLHLFTMPLILGRGTRLFADGPGCPATLIQSRTWPSGAAESVYDFTDRFLP
jgi:riboflavin biosynthesis pyrimidine reductase